MVRPRLHRSSLRTKKIIFRLTDAEFLLLAHGAAATEMKVNAYARILTLRQSGVSKKSDAVIVDPALIKQLHYIGHNLNQLTKNAHIYHRISPNVERLCLRIEALIDQAIGKENNP